MPMTVDEIRKYFPIALRLAREKANLQIDVAARKAKVNKLTLENHEIAKNPPTLDFFFKELNAYGLDFMTFHELLLEVRIKDKLQTPLNSKSV